MNTSLMSLIPRPISVQTDTIVGELNVTGTIERNVIQFRFRFTDSQEAAPIVLSIHAGEKIYRYYCLIQDKETSEMVTPIFSPEFCVGQRFTVTAVEPLVIFEPIKKKDAQCNQIEQRA